MIKIIVFVLCAAICTILIGSYQKTLVIPLSICAGCVAFLFIFDSLKTTILQIESLSAQVGIQSVYIKLLLKIIGVAYLCEFTSSVCRDCGQTSFAMKIDLAGKVLILSQSIPAFAELLKIIRTILPF